MSVHAVLTLALFVTLFDCGDDHGPGRGAAPAQAAPPVAPAQPTPSDLATELTRPESLAARREGFARAVELISRDLGEPIAGERALKDMPCGGWSGPECSNLTLGLEAAKLVAPIAARLYDDRAERITAILVAAISTHSVWHDAFGYVWSRIGRGPGYVYAGCLLSSCAPEDRTAGQADGILYQVARQLGVLHTPACGPACTLSTAP